jgi:hypothetical protein
MALLIKLTQGKTEEINISFMAQQKVELRDLIIIKINGEIYIRGLYFFLFFSFILFFFLHFQLLSLWLQTHIE